MEAQRLQKISPGKSGRTCLGSWLDFDLNLPLAPFPFTPRVSGFFFQKVLVLGLGLGLHPFVLRIPDISCYFFFNPKEA